MYIQRDVLCEINFTVTYTTKTSFKRNVLVVVVRFFVISTLFQYTSTLFASGDKITTTLISFFSDEIGNKKPKTNVATCIILAMFKLVYSSKKLFVLAILSIDLLFNSIFKQYGIKCKFLNDLKFLVIIQIYF